MPISYKKYLNDDQETMPKWLVDYKAGDKIDVNTLLTSNVFVYPGAFFDGVPLRILNSAKCAYVYIYIDYNYSRDNIIEHSQEFNGYELIDINFYNWDEFCLNIEGSNKNIFDETIFNDFRFSDSFVSISVYKRNPDKTEEHGFEKFVLVSVCNDAFYTYFKLFNRERIPKVVMLFDYEGYCDYGYASTEVRFGGEGLLYQIALNNHCFPKYILNEERAICWLGYTKIEEVMPAITSSYHTKLFLYKKSKMI